MESFSIIDRIVKELEEDADSTRIKKIIYYTCERKWENDENKLEEINLKELIEELYAKMANIETLDNLLSRVVSKVNKKTEYALLTHKILNSVSKLYPQEEDMTVMEYTQDWSFVGSDGQNVLKEQLVAEESSPRNPGKLFHVREKIIQGTNPLKAKILIFSTVERQFDFGDRNWLLLKTKNLDSLLRQIFNLCPSMKELESSLYSIANNFEDPDEYTQIANIIIRALTTCYLKEMIVPQSKVEAEKYKESSLDRKKTNIETDSDFKKDDMTPEYSKQLATRNYENEIRCQEEEYIISDEEPISYIEEIIYKGKNKIEEQGIGDLLIKNKQIPSPVATDSKKVTLVQDEKASLEGENILDVIKEKLKIEDEISIVVNQKIDVVMNAIEVEFIALEKTLNNLLQSHPEEKRLSLKYTALGDLISNIQDKYTKYQEIIRQLEIEERKKINFNDSGNTLNQELDPEKEIHDENQQEIIQLATEGNPNAVAMIINQLLGQQGIKVIVRRKNDYLHIVLESKQVPNPEIVTPIVEQKIASLQSEYLKNIKIHGRQLGNKSIIWTKTILW